MQDRICRIDENLLHRAAGPYIGVRSVALYIRRLPINFRYSPFATEIARRCNMSRRAHLRTLAALCSHAPEHPILLWEMRLHS